MQQLVQIQEVILVLWVVLVVLVGSLLKVVMVVVVELLMVVNRKILQLMVVVQEDLLEQQFEEILDILLLYKILDLHLNFLGQRVPQELHK